MNKILGLIILILTPLTLISFKKKETNFYIEEKEEPEVKISYNNEQLNMNLEEYVIGVIAAEMPASFEVEALKAQAIAARTFALKKLEEKDCLLTDITDQVYIDETKMKEKWQDEYDLYYNKIKEVVEATKGKVLKYQDKLINAYYYARSNGYTESSINVFNEKIEYLNSKESLFEPLDIRETKMEKQEFCNKLNIDCNEIRIDSIIKDESKRVSSLLINDKLFTGIEIRKLLNLRSTDFDIKIGDEISITTTGYGHGVGMSQYGANALAKNGYTYEEILKYYYEKTEIYNL